jgi:hypothetical protein
MNVMLRLNEVVIGLNKHDNPFSLMRIKLKHNRLKAHAIALLILFTFPFSGSGMNAPEPSANKIIPDYNRHSLGFQFNPYLEKNASSELFKNYYLLMGAIRYSYQANPNTTLGAELPATHHQMGENRSYSTLGLGAFGRYWIWQMPWVRTGVEGNMFVTRRFYQWNSENQHSNSLYKKYWRQPYHFMYFVSPVVSLSKKESRWSFDLMYKFTHKQERNYWNKSVFSYRINYHF